MSEQDGFSKDWQDDDTDPGEQYILESAEVDLVRLYGLPLPGQR